MTDWKTHIPKYNGDAPDDVWDDAHSAWIKAGALDRADYRAAATVIRSMCRPIEEPIA